MNRIREVVISRSQTDATQHTLTITTDSGANVIEALSLPDLEHLKRAVSQHIKAFGYSRQAKRGTPK